MNKKIEEIANRYCSAINDYEKYLEKYKVNNREEIREFLGFLREEIDKKGLEFNEGEVKRILGIKEEKSILDLIDLWLEKQVMPWRFVKGDLKKHLIDIFSRNDEEILDYLRVEDEILDLLENQLEIFVKNDYIEKGLDLKDHNVKDEIIQKVINFTSKSELDSDLFPEDIVELHKIVEKFRSVCEEVSNIYRGIYFSERKENVIMGTIEVVINNNGVLRLSQTESDIERGGVALESIDSNGKVSRRDLIDEGDFVMLMNYYRFVKDYDVKDEFINRNGTNRREDYLNDTEDIELGGF